MDAHVILDLMKEMRHSGIESLEWQAEGQSLRLVRPPMPAPGAPGSSGAAGAAGSAGSDGSLDGTAGQTDAIGSIDATAGRPGTDGERQAAGVREGRRSEGRLVSSPVVGIFYAAAAPDQDPFVVPGSVVEAGAPLGIIEAMKLMNEVTSPCGGTVSEVLVENGQRVEYGQPLFTIKENAR